MTFDRLHHVVIIVSSREKAKEFYGEKLGLPILRESFRPDKGDWKLDLRLGDGELEIFAVPSAPARPSYPEALGLRHLAFRVDDIRKAVAELEGKGIACEPIRVDPCSGRPFTFFRDPDGLPLELHE